MWTNYESKSVDVPLTSLNYLGNHMYKVAGIGLPAYNRFLQHNSIFDNKRNKVFF